MVDNPLHDIHNYSPTMKISQLMLFCEKKGIGITRAMIQNYIRDGLLPPPVNKRLYTHKHIAAMVLIERLKSVFEIPDVRDALTPFMDDEGLPLETYQSLWNKTEILMRNLTQTNIFDAEKDGGTLLTMACAAAIKHSILGGHSHESSH
jgi:DNA-binding transcriptional MerR regulator